MRLVLDTNTVISGLLWKGPLHALLTAARDDRKLACAVAAAAELIVSGDADLLDLKAYQGIPIVTAAEALTLLPQR